MYKTDTSKWLKAIFADTIFIGALIAGVVFGVPYTLQVSVFFMWWLSALGLVAGLILLTMSLAVESLIRDLERDLALLDPDSHKAKEVQIKIQEAKDSIRKVWSDSLVDKLAASTPYLVYHWVTDAVIWVLLIVAGHPILATFKVASFLVVCMVISVARRLYRERRGLPDPDEVSATAAHK